MAALGVMRRRASFSLAGRLTSLSLLAFTLSLLVGGYAGWTVYDLHEKQTVDLTVDELSESTLLMDELQETLQGAVYARFSGLDEGVAGTDATEAAAELQQLAFGFADGDDGEELRRLGTSEYVLAQRATVLLAGARPTRTQVEQFRAAAVGLTVQIDAAHDALQVRRDAAAAARESVVIDAIVRLSVVAAGTGVILFLVGWAIRRWLVTSLRRLADVARAVAEGDLGARAAFTGDDEVAEVARALDDTSASLQKAFAELDAEAGRQDFRARLDRALGQAESDDDVAEYVGRALTQVHPGLPVELLLADSSEAHLRTLASTPGVAAPGCRAPTPWSCPAVRGGRTLRYASGEELDACPHLRARPEGDRSAACIPVSFMGRVTGVLHATNAPGALPSEDELVRLELVAERSGARLGALHALDQVQRQAALDGLTGLPNRRSFENAVRELRTRRYGLLLADLDRFKAINDTFGHAAGDQALRRFADVLRGCLRDVDLPCRLGGEEFVVAVPEGSAVEASVVAERLRAALAASALEAAGPSFTVSIGVSDSTMADTLPEQLALADAALLAAKRAGRDRTLVARDDENPVSEPPVEASR